MRNLRKEEAESRRLVADGMPPEYFTARIGENPCASQEIHPNRRFFPGLHPPGVQFWSAMIKRPVRKPRPSSRLGLATSAEKAPVPRQDAPGSTNRTCLRCLDPIPVLRRKGAVYCSHRCAKAAGNAMARARGDRKVKSHPIACPRGSQRGVEPVLRDVRREAGCATTAGPAETDWKAKGWPKPASVVHGLPLYRCSPMSLLITPTQCEFSRRVAAGQVEPDKELGHPIDKENRVGGTKVQLYADELEARAAMCRGCPGVLALAAGRKGAKREVAEELPRAASTQMNALSVALSGGEW
jgi:hypothetical protein